MSTTTAQNSVGTETSTETCGARHPYEPGVACTLAAHADGTRHLDESAGNLYHSVSWR